MSVKQIQHKEYKCDRCFTAKWTDSDRGYDFTEIQYQNITTLDGASTQTVIHLCTDCSLSFRSFLETNEIFKRPKIPLKGDI